VAQGVLEVLDRYNLEVSVHLKLILNDVLIESASRIAPAVHLY